MKPPAEGFAPHAIVLSFLAADKDADANASNDRWFSRNACQVMSLRTGRCDCTADGGLRPKPGALRYKHRLLHSAQSAQRTLPYQMESANFTPNGSKLYGC